MPSVVYATLFAALALATAWNYVAIGELQRQIASQAGPQHSQAVWSQDIPIGPHVLPSQLGHAIATLPIPRGAHLPHSPWIVHGTED